MNSPNYYKTNALYNHLDANPDPKFYFTSGNMWQLIYGDAEVVPRLLVLVTGMPGEQLKAPLIAKEAEAKQLLGWLSKKIAIPLLHIRFADDVVPSPTNPGAELEQVTVVSEAGDFESITLRQLTELYRGYGLPVKAQPTTKPVNDATSSAYHKWQRGYLGPIKVSDVDLWVVGENREPQRVFELKRSFKKVTVWKPYPDDFVNFKLLYNAFTPAKLKVFIAYNIRQENPWNDDISQLKVFLLDFSPGKNPPYVEYKTPITLDHFLGQ